jgi:hypothetical protein
VRRFVFAARPWTDPEPAICCDGLVDGAGLHLTHWRGNRTPAALKADTSTEIALRFVDSTLAPAWADAPVLNNHFDTDGVLSVWTLLHPEAARARRALLVAAAEAGDFDAWPAERRGLWVDAALRAVASTCADEAAAYDRALAVLPQLLDEIDRHHDLWGPEWEAIEAAERGLETGGLMADRLGGLGIVHHKPGTAEIPAPLLARELGLDCRRYLLVFERDAGLDYRYELPHWTWADTVLRPQMAPPEAAALLAALGPDWTADDPAGMTDVVHTRQPVSCAPDALVRTLLEHDPELGHPPQP